MRIIKKPWVLLLFGTLLLGFLSQCSTVNIFPPAAYWNYRFSHLPLLKDHVQTDTYEVVFIDKFENAIIRYNPAGRFFVVDGYKLRKFDATGHQTFVLGDGIDFKQLANTPYYYSPDGVYDMTQETVTIAPITQYYNATDDPHTDKAEWNDAFGALFARSEVVTHFGHHAGYGKYITLFKTNQGWVLFFTPDTVVNITDNPFGGYTFDGYPEKYDPMIFLKAPSGGGYTDAKDWVSSHVTENTLTYPTDLGIHMLSFRKDTSLGSVYLPFPLELFGQAAYAVPLGDDVLKFQETATTTLGGLPQSNLSHYILPDEYQNDTAISFIEFAPTVNYGSSGSDGLYIVRPK